jgi:hypothetical protein
MSDKIEKPYPWATVDLKIGRHHFEACADAEEPMEYIVSTYREGVDIWESEPVGSVKVGREDFLAMLEVAKVQALLEPKGEQ